MTPRESLDPRGQLRKAIEETVATNQLAHCCSGFGCETNSKIYAKDLMPLIDAYTKARLLAIVGEDEQILTRPKPTVADQMYVGGRNQLRQELRTAIEEAE